MSRILNLVKKLEKSQPISVKLVTKIVKKSTFSGCIQSNGFAMGRILNQVKNIKKLQPILVKMVKKIDLYRLYPIEWDCNDSNF